LQIETGKTKKEQKKIIKQDRIATTMWRCNNDEDEEYCEVK
jgi:hypothetical protein